MTAGTPIEPEAGDDAGAFRPPAPDTHQKALAVNLDPTSFGSFAEIGAGQEVARWFLRVGGASGTVAKTVSAYDKEVSDDLYGSGTRYVSKPRLEAMLEREWVALRQQVGAARAESTRLFVFADTVAARNFAGTNDCHGWIGVRFQGRPGAEHGDVFLHVNLRDRSNLLQQEAVGVLGVNLLHALLNERAGLDELPARLFDDLVEGRVEVDQVDARGAVLADGDAVAFHAALARDGRAEAILIDADGRPVAANEFLYKRALVIESAAPDPRDDLSLDAVGACVETLRAQVARDADVTDVIDARRIVVEPDGGSLPRAPTTAGRATMITRHPALYRTTAFVRRYTTAPLRFAVTLPELVRILDEARYHRLEGRLLEGVARLFGHDVQVLAYPSLRRDLHGLAAGGAPSGWELEGDEEWITADRLRPAPPLGHLYAYLLATGFLVAMPPSSRLRVTPAPGASTRPT